MVWLIIFIFISIFVIILASIPIVRKFNIFKHGHEGTGTVVDVSSFHDMNSKGRYRVNVEYDVDGMTYSQSFSMEEEECKLKKGDCVPLLYDLKRPKNAHISVDSSSCFSYFQRLIITMTAIAVLAIGMRSILVYLSPANNSSLISLIAFFIAALILLMVLGIYMSIHVILSKSQNIIDGEVINRIGKKNEFTYKVKYNVNGCLFTFLYNSKDNMEIGTIVNLTYLEHIPFIAHIA